MDDATEVRAPADNEAGDAPASESREVVVHVDHAAAAAAEPEHAQPTVAEPAQEPAPAPVHHVTLDDYCAAKTKRMHGHVELVSAFGALERAGHHLLDTTENYDTAFDALRSRPAK